MDKLLATVKLEVWIALAGFLLGLWTTLNAAVTWYGESVRKQYAVERDFNHLKTNYKQLAENMATIDKSVDSFKDMVMKELTEIKSMLYATIAKRHYED